MDIQEFERKVKDWVNEYELINETVEIKYDKNNNNYYAALTSPKGWNRGILYIDEDDNIQLSN